MNINQFNNSMNEYYQNSVANERKDLIKRIVLFVLALVHRYVLYDRLNKMLEEVLLKNNVSEDIIDYILIAYFVITMLFLIITAWKVIKNIKVLNIIFVVAILVYAYFNVVPFVQNTKLYQDITNRPRASYVIEAKQLADYAKTNWKRETITDGERQKTYIKKGDTYCNNIRLTLTSNDIEYAITLDNKGNIIDYKITDGKFQYSYSGDGLFVDDIKSSNFEKVNESNEIIIPNCY